MTVLNLKNEAGRVIAEIADGAMTNGPTAQGAAANPCNGCHAMYHDTAPVDFFDCLQEQSRTTFRAQCTLVADGAKPCMQSAPARPATQPPSLRGLVVEAQDAAGDMRTLLQAHTALEWMVANVPEHGMPRPGDLGALLSVVNESMAVRLAALESAVGAMRDAV